MPTITSWVSVEVLTKWSNVKYPLGLKILTLSRNFFLMYTKYRELDAAFLI